jgi:hypothetical protein
MKILDQCFRVYATADAIDATIAFYEQLQGVTCARRVTIPETNVVAARVGNFLIVKARSPGPRVNYYRYGSVADYTQRTHTRHGSQGSYASCHGGRVLCSKSD